MLKASGIAHVDANIVVRFLLGEPPHQAEAARALFDGAGRQGPALVIHPTVLAEVVYVLTSPRIAALSRTAVAAALRGLFAMDGVATQDLDVVLEALDRFENSRLDWVDCLMLGYSPDIPVHSFDAALLAASRRRLDG